MLGNECAAHAVAPRRLGKKKSRCSLLFTEFTQCGCHVFLNVLLLPGLYAKCIMEEMFVSLLLINSKMYYVRIGMLLFITNILRDPQKKL